MDFTSFITELNKIGDLHKQGKDQTKELQLLFDSIYKDFLSFDMEQAEHARNIIIKKDLQQTIYSYSTGLSQSNMEEWLTKWLLSFVLTDGTGDYRDDLFVVRDTLKDFPSGMDWRSIVNRAAALANGDENNKLTVRGLLTSHAKKGFIERFFGPRK